MADLIQKDQEPSAPAPKNKGNKIAALIFLVLAVVCGLVYWKTNLTVVLAVGGGALLISFINFIAGINFPTYTPEAKRYGDMGERVTGSILERYLPDGYTVIQNAKIYYDDGVSETDNIIVGRTGVFVVEVKNIKGYITGDYADRDWHQDKTDRYGIEHEKEFYSPVKQIGTHIYRLANFLRDNKIFTHINGAVYFANPATEVELTGEPNNVPVFTHDTTQELLDYIMSGTANLSESKIQKIIQLLS